MEEVGLPEVVGLGSEVPLGNTKTSHWGTFPEVFQLMVALDAVIPMLLKLLGVPQFGVASQETLAIQPARLFKPSLLNLNVKLPSGLEDLNGPGTVVPQKEPGSPSPAGRDPALFALGI